MKLPKSLTTVTPFSKTLALVMFIIFPLAGFYIGMQYQKALDVYQSYSLINTGSAKDETTITVDMSSIGKVQYAHVGNTVIVSLPTNFTWGIDISPDGILQSTSTGTHTYKAMKEGTITIMANGRPQCLRGHLCSMLAIPFKTELIVSK